MWKQCDNVKGVICGDQPIYNLNLQLPSALRRIVASFGSLFSIQPTTLLVHSHHSHGVISKNALKTTHLLSTKQQTDTGGD